MIAAAIAVGPRMAAAQVDVAEVDKLVAEGEELARQGEFSQAIDRFQKADAIAERTRHACLIGLVYTRRELWAEAELFFARCRSRATVTDPVPDWLAEAERQLAAKLAVAEVAPVEIRIEPAGVAARVTVSLAPDEYFAPRVIHLPRGNHTITAALDGYETTSETVEIKSRDAVVVTLTMRKPGAVVAPVPVPAPDVRPARGRSPAKWLWIGAGGAAVIGVGFHFLASRERGYLEDARETNSTELYDKHESAFDTYRAVTFAAYGAAITAGVIGTVLYMTRDRESASGPELGGTITGDGAMVTLGWRR